MAEQADGGRVLDENGRFSDFTGESAFVLNMLEACRRVKANKGTPDVDGMTVDKSEAHLRRHGASIRAYIREGKYIPSPMRRVDIPKFDGGARIRSSSRLNAALRRDAHGSWR